ncbi:MAG: sigma-70 family RNA polymerase sigma factor [bacterium]|nr:sigma-70 family RNA polymerase sigma factor [bacterium]
MRPDDPDPSRRARFWSDVLRREHHALFGAAMAWCGQTADAEDLMQDTLIQLARSPRTIDDPVAYVMRTMLNRRRNDLKRSGVHRNAIASIRATVADRGAGSNRASELLASVEQLPADQQEVLTLRTRCGLSFPQIALVLDEPVGTVSSRYSRAIAALREMILEGASRG